MTAAWRLVESNPWSPRSRNPALVLAILVHLLVLAALGIGQLLRVVPPPEEPFTGTAILAVLLEPPPLEPPILEEPPFEVEVPRGTPEAPALSREAAPERLPDLPDAAPPSVGDLDTRAVPELPGFGERTQPGPGSRSGPGGEGEGIRGLPDGEDLIASLEVVGRVIAPKLLHKVEPDYPEAARLSRMSGKVIVSAVIARDGSVEDVTIVSATSRVFEDATLEAVRQWRYTPAMLDGRPVRVAFLVRVEFTLN